MARPPHWTKCPHCQRDRPQAVIQDGMCDFDRNEAERLEASVRQFRRELDVSWNGPEGDAVRVERNRLLDTWEWATRPGSPLTAACQAQFIEFFGRLHRLTVDYVIPSTVVWPDVPVIEYGGSDGN